MVKNGCGLKYGDHSGILYSSTNENWEKLFIQKHKLTTINFDIIPEKHLDHEERKVPKYEVRVFVCACHFVISSIHIYIYILVQNHDG